MVLGREFEEMCAQMYYRGKMFGFVHLYSGQVGGMGVTCLHLPGAAVESEQLLGCLAHTRTRTPAPRTKPQVAERFLLTGGDSWSCRASQPLSL